MRSIDPSLFTRLMRLPAAVRVDLLEFLGATPIGNSQLSQMIETIVAQLDADRMGRAELH